MDTVDGGRDVVEDEDCTEVVVERVEVVPVLDLDLQLLTQILLLETIGVSSCFLNLLLIALKTPP